MINDTKRMNNKNEDNIYYPINDPFNSDISNTKLNFNYSNLNTNSDKQQLSTLNSEYNPNLTNYNVNNKSVSGGNNRINLLLHDNDLLKEEILSLKKSLKREKVKFKLNFRLNCFLPKKIITNKKTF